MPVYEYDCQNKRCLKHRHTTTVYLNHYKRDTDRPPKCEGCGKPLSMIFSLQQPVNYGFTNYTTENITGEPIEITGPKHRERLMRDHNLRLQEPEESRKEQGHRVKPGSTKFTNAQRRDILEKARANR